MEEHNDKVSTAAATTATTHSCPLQNLLNEESTMKHYVDSDALHRHILRQSVIVCKAIEQIAGEPMTLSQLSKLYESQLFCPSTPPKKQENGTCELNPNVNFYPTFMIPETLASYHIFFNNMKIPASCRANRTKADEELMLGHGSHLPDFPSTDVVPKIFEGLGSEEPALTKPLEANTESVLVELKCDNPRLAVMKRSVTLSHFAYPALNLPPKVMSCIMDTLIITRGKELKGETCDTDVEGGKPIVTNEELAKWLNVNEDDVKVEERRKTMLAVVLVTVQLECMARFFTSPQMIKKISENLHYMFKHGYVKLACKISNLDLTNLVSYMGILHENRLGQNVLHNTLSGEARRDYIRDTVYLFLIYTWQTAMGVWQQCLQSENLKELEKLLKKSKKELWSGFDEKTIAKDLADIIFPYQLLNALDKGLPDFTSQSMMQIFRAFVLERSGILPAICNAFPSDFVPIKYKECPPPLWGYCYIMQLANYMMFHSDVAWDTSGEGILECYCRCNLCNPHRCLVTNTPLLNEIQAIDSFEIQGPPKSDGSLPKPFKLTAGSWTSAFLRHFIPEDFYPNEIKFFEEVSHPSKVTPTACVITQTEILAQLQEIKKSREEFLLKKGHGVYLDPSTGEELNTSTSSIVNNAHLNYRTKTRQTNFSKSDKPQDEETFDETKGGRSPPRRKRSGRGGGMVRRHIRQQRGRGYYGGRSNSAPSIKESEEGD
ncbi:p100K [bottlenose dolphin adenovirus 2]|uniref:Shutoff protein n=1 Tax=bottlenose dolphin adenovirus 2 TaxID=2849592 RepID=A0A0M5L6C2_9ADEN|nr:p100K [Bottlenose dolphin adenovirus 1]ALE15307.1 p100K [Bottlenose dolphin adenovirus 1]